MGVKELGVDIAGFYGRVSSKRQARGDSLENQRWDAEQFGCTVFFSESRSGFSKKDRAEFARFIQWGRDQAEQGIKVALVTARVDRFARNLNLTMSLVEDLESAGIKLWALNYGSMSVQNYRDWENLARQALQAESYSRQLSENIGRANASKRRRGLPCGKAPYGWRWSEDKTRWIADTEGDPSPWDITKAMVDYALEGLTTHTIRIKLWKEYKYKVYRETVAWRLKNPILYGAMRYTSYPELGVTPGVHEPICSYEEFKQIQKNLADNKSHWGKHQVNVSWRLHRINTTLIRCAHCGKPPANSHRTRKDGSIRRYFYCHTPHCNHPPGTIRADRLEEMIQDKLAERAEEIAQAYAEPIKVTPSAEQIKLEDEIKTLKKARADAPGPGINADIEDKQQRLKTIKAQHSLKATSDVAVNENLREAIADKSLWKFISEADLRRQYALYVDVVEISGRDVVNIELTF